ncbi:MAG: hypothetical protein ACD_31C00064G0001 [uncultured bacterium]|nr:MAG: hypothetical protein ACD_31C00064G0001 [uncultured bacterium]
MNKKNFLFFSVIVGIQLIVLINSKFTVWPEMILYPWLINNKFDLYKDIINPYFPLLPLVLAKYFSILGISILNLKLFTYTVIILSDLLVFLISKKLSSSVKALGVLIAYCLLQFSFGGNQLWFELALTPFALAYVYFLIGKNPKKQDYLMAGFCIAICGLIKQNALLFYIPALYLILTSKKIKELIYFLIPGFLSYLVMFGYFLVNGILSGFYSWAILLTLSLTKSPGFVSLPTKRQYLQILVPFFSLYGLKFSEMKIFWSLNILVAAVFIFPRYEDFHMQVVIAFLAVFSSFLPKKYFLVFLLIAVLFFGRSLKANWQTQDRFLDQEMYKIAGYIKDYDSVYLLNSPELAYFFANKLPPKPWAINFPWYFEMNNFENRFIVELAKNQPEVIIIGNPIGGEKYDLGNYLPEKLMDFIKLQYNYSGQSDTYQVWRVRI